MVVTTLLVKNFPYIFDMDYTRRLEEELDEVEAGNEKWTDLLDGFYDHLSDEIKVAEKSMEDIKRMEHSTEEELCEKCGSPLILKVGQVRLVLLLLGLHQGQAEDDRRLRMEEGRERPRTSV